jgi:lipopolysaccharide/colanic/teichoic acid biosynthesis glycosyltransferase
VIRRIVDVVVSAAVLILLFPVFLVVAMVIRLDSPGSVIYRARRVGKDGRPFQMLKFRSMVAGADRHGSVITARTDSRITRVGRFLRASKLDEFPQFWNVLTGQMTLIGPRPESPEIVARYTPEQRQVLSARPGLTGPSQISCSVDASMAILSSDAAEQFYIQHVLDRRLAIDTEYIQNRNLFTDLALIGRTMSLILRVFLRGQS